MTGKEFDQAIKGKAEQAQYPFKEAAWDSFSQKSGLASGHRFKGAHTVLSIAVAAVITTTAIFGLLTHANKTRQQPQMPAETAVADSASVTSDTSVIQLPQKEEVAASPHVDRFDANTVTKKTVAKKNNVAAVPVVNDTLLKGQTDKSETKPVSHRTRAIYGRPLEINVDTITDMEPTDEQLRNGNSRLF